jgi:hypothetical protein
MRNSKSEISAYDLAPSLTRLFFVHQNTELMINLCLTA